VVRRSRIAGLGLFTMKFVPCGTRLCEFTGEAVRASVATMQRARPTAAAPAAAAAGRGAGQQSVLYMYRVTPDPLLDASRRSSIARFANHSCM